MQEKSWEIKEIPTWVSQKEASALAFCKDFTAIGQDLLEFTTLTQDRTVVAIVQLDRTVPS